MLRPSAPRNHFVPNASLPRAPSSASPSDVAMFIKNIFFLPFRSRYSAIAVFGVHFIVCLIILIVGGLIGQGESPAGTFAAAHVFRFLGHLISLLLALIFIVCLITLRGGLCFTYLWFGEFVACVLQFLAWIFDAVNAVKLRVIGGPSYGLDVASTLFGVFGSFLTLFIAIALSKRRIALAEMCGGTTDCCGLTTDGQNSNHPAGAYHERPVDPTTGQAEISGKQSV